MDYHYYERISTQYELEQFDSGEEFLLQQGHIPVLISTPHSVTHFRNDKEKTGEFMTAAIAQKLHEVTGCSIITKIKNNLTDPNFDETHPFKDAMVHFVQANNVRFVFDLHIMSSKREAAIEIGTGKGKNIFHKNHIATHLKNAFEKQAITPVIVDELFTAGNPNTVCSTVAKQAQIPCVQIEMNWRIVNTKESSSQIDGIIEAFAEVIQQLLRND